MSLDAGSYDPRFFPALAEMERRHFWYRARRRVVAAALARVASSLPPGYRVLEVGCGAGGMLEALAGACRGGRVAGLDLHPAGLAIARRRAGALLVAGDAARAPFRARFHLVALFDVLEHLDDDAEALRHAAALLAPGGLLVATVPASPALWSWFDEAARHRRRYTERALREALRAGGLVPRYVTPFLSPFLPLVWAGRKLGRPPADAGARTARALRTPRLLNGPLGLLAAWEPAVVRRGGRLPFGTSLLALAERAT